jgi:hypothetical protein
MHEVKLLAKISANINHLLIMECAILTVGEEKIKKG